MRFRPRHADIVDQEFAAPTIANPIDKATRMSSKLLVESLLEKILLCQDWPGPEAWKGALPVWWYPGSMMKEKSR